MLNELSPTLSAVSLYSQDVTYRIDILNYLLIYMVPCLGIVMHLEEPKVLLQCRGLLWTSLGVQDDLLEESFVLGCVRIPEGVNGLAEACFEAKTVAKLGLENIFIHDCRLTLSTASVYD